MKCFESDSVHALFGQVIRAHFQLSHALLEKLGVYPGQPPLLFALRNQEGLSQKELASKLNIKPATMTVMLKRMENAKLIERIHDKTDQRITRVYLTDEGRVLQEEAHEVMKVIHRECFQNFSQEEEEFLKKMFVKMRENLIHASDKNKD
ncbi:MAG: MarR family transcriptional regulator [Firmicutes bacterium HGW-Firmicutes-1]|jgi:DNA-binding MarR family transcriptional regulator|nr:MAG: MarR family transcriptional regulator [Firmicutes bacterium HGW-Firmicutes-1]